MQQGLNFDIIISSPLLRAYDTACHIAKEFEYPAEKIITNDLFKERCYGILDGTNHGDTMAKYILDETSIDDYEGVESLVEIQERAGKAWAYLQNLPQDSVLLVSHGAFGRALRRAIRNEPLNVIGRHYKNAEIERIF